MEDDINAGLVMSWVTAFSGIFISQPYHFSWSPQKLYPTPSCKGSGDIKHVCCPHPLLTRYDWENKNVIKLNLSENDFGGTLHHRPSLSTLVTCQCPTYLACTLM